MRSTITNWDQVPLMVPIPTAAETVGVSRSTFYGLLNAGKIQSKRVGARVFITKVELQRFCEGGDPRAA